MKAAPYCFSTQNLSPTQMGFLVQKSIEEFQKEPRLAKPSVENIACSLLQISHVSSGFALDRIEDSNIAPMMVQTHSCST